MTTNYYFTLTFFTRKPRAEGYTDHKVYVRISAAGQYTDLYIGRSVNPDNWDQKRKMSKGRSRRDLELNKYLDEIRARFSEIHTTLVRDNKAVNPIIMRNLFLGKIEKPKMLCDIFREANEKRKEELDRGDIVKAAGEISETSHKEKAWIANHQTRSEISYQDAFALHYS